MYMIVHVHDPCMNVLALGTLAARICTRMQPVSGGIPLEV